MPADIVRRIHRDNAGVELQFFGDRVAHHENPCVAACRRRSAAATLFPHRYQRTRTHLATTLQLHSRWCAHPTAMWQDRLAMWSPVKMVYNSKLDEPSMQARKPDHRASLRRHRTHTVVRSHQYDTLASADACPVFFVVTPLAAKTICPSGNCSRMAVWYLFPREARVRTLTRVRPRSVSVSVLPTLTRTSVYAGLRARRSITPGNLPVLVPLGDKYFVVRIARVTRTHYGSLVPGPRHRCEELPHDTYFATVCRDGGGYQGDSGPHSRGA